MTDSELIVYCDDHGLPTGKTAPKLASHHDKTEKHLAFSLYLFNEAGELLVTQRAESKKVWPGVWTNSVCGHLMPGESIQNAMIRRLNYELGMSATDFQILIEDYTYTTPAFQGIVENEYCPVFRAQAIGTPKPNPLEVANFSWVTWNDFKESCDSDVSNSWSWWCKDQLKYINNKV